jgi:antitoxin MazE
MRTSIKRWGNSLALRIPKVFAREANIAEDTPVALSVVDGKVVISPVAQAAPSLEDLVAGITDENRHGEWETSPAG